MTAELQVTLDKTGNVKSVVIKPTLEELEQYFDALEEE